MLKETSSSGGSCHFTSPPSRCSVYLQNYRIWGKSTRSGHCCAVWDPAEAPLHLPLSPTLLKGGGVLVLLLQLLAGGHGAVGGQPLEFMAEFTCQNKTLSETAGSAASGPSALLVCGCVPWQEVLRPVLLGRSEGTTRCPGQRGQRVPSQGGMQQGSGSGSHIPSYSGWSQCLFTVQSYFKADFKNNNKRGRNRCHLALSSVFMLSER